MTKHSIKVGDATNQWIWCTPSGEPSEPQMLDAIVADSSFDSKIVFRFAPRFETSNHVQDESRRDSAQEEWMKYQTPIERADIQWFVDVYCQ